MLESANGNGSGASQIKIDQLTYKAFWRTVVHFGKLTTFRQ